MVEGLRTSRPLIKFRRVLPIAALLFVTASTYRYYHPPPRLVTSPGGRPLVLGGNRARPMIVATAINLPAGIIAIPLELAVLGPEGEHKPHFEAFRVVEFSLLGMIFWFYAGRYFDDLIAWRNVRSGSRWRLTDCLVAAVIAAETTFLTVVLSFQPHWSVPEFWLFSCTIGWGLLGYSAFIFRVFQLRSYPRRDAPPGRVS